MTGGPFTLGYKQQKEHAGKNKTKPGNTYWRKDSPM